MRDIKGFISLFVLLSLSFSCNEKQQQDLILDKVLTDPINSYINENPLKLPISGNLYENGYSYPSYHIYFQKKEEDVLMSIIQHPHLSEFSLESIKNSNGEDVYKEQKSDGFLIYENKYPLIFFGINNYKESFFKEILNKEIPDSLKFNRENYHIGYLRKDFILKNRMFIDLNPR